MAHTVGVSFGRIVFQDVVVLCYKMILFPFITHRHTKPTIMSTDDTDSGSEIESIMYDMGIVASSGEEEDHGK